MIYKHEDQGLVALMSFGLKVAEPKIDELTGIPKRIESPNSIFYTKNNDENTVAYSLSESRATLNEKAALKISGLLVPKGLYRTSHVVVGGLPEAVEEEHNGVMESLKLIVAPGPILPIPMGVELYVAMLGEAAFKIFDMYK